jgi:hypothetical protein
MSSIESCKYSNVILSTQELKFIVQEGYSLPPDQIIGLERAVPTDLSPTWEAFSRARWISYNPKFCHKYDAVPNQIQVNIMEKMAVGKYQDIITLSASNGVEILPSPVVSIVLEVQPKPPPPVEPLKIITATLSDGEVGKAYECQIEADGGVPPYIWTCTGLPDGLVFYIAPTPQIGGTPTASGDFPITISVRDFKNNSVSTTLGLHIIALAKVAITSPVGGEILYVGDTWVITWVADDGEGQTLNIELFYDGNSMLIAGVPIKALRYSWQIVEGVSEDAIIRLVTIERVVESGPFAIRERTGCAIPWPLAKVLKKVRKLVTQYREA